MSNSTEVQTNRAITVPFHGVDLYVVEHNSQPYTPMKAIVMAMGLDWKSQHRKVVTNEARWGVLELRTPSATMVDSTTVGSADGKSRELTCIPVRKVAAWLTTIEPGKIKNPEVRARVIQYQNECDDVLWRYWNEGIAENPRARPYNPAIDYDRISPAQAQDLKEIVEAIVKAGVQGFPETWSRLHRKFKVNSYLELPATRHLDARNYLIAKLPVNQPYGLAEEPPKRETLNEQIEKLVYQLEAHNGISVDLVMPLYDAVNRKMQERGWFRVNGLMPDAQAKEVFSRAVRLGQLFNPMSTQFDDVTGIIRVIQGLDPKFGLKRDDFLQLADQRMLALH